MLKTMCMAFPSPIRSCQCDTREASRVHACMYGMYDWHAMMWAMQASCVNVSSTHIWHLYTHELPFETLVRKEVLAVNVFLTLTSMLATTCLI